MCYKKKSKVVFCGKNHTEDKTEFPPEKHMLLDVIGYTKLNITMIYQLSDFVCVSPTPVELEGCICRLCSC